MTDDEAERARGTIQALRRELERMRREDVRKTVLEAFTAARDGAMDALVRTCKAYDTMHNTDLPYTEEQNDGVSLAIYYLEQAKQAIIDAMEGYEDGDGKRA